MASTQVTIIGAGSVVFSLHLVKGMCLTESLAGSSVTFMDINEERLDIIYNMARRYAEDVGADLRFAKTTSREEALRDADFVVSSVTVNDEYYNRKARQLADSMGYYYGRSGMLSYYNLQLMLDVARDMERLCPDALLIQAGNPVSTGTSLVTRETDINMVGICHGHYGYTTIARTLGLDVDKITWQAPGINHNIWLTDFFYEGQDAYPLIDKWIEEEAEKFWAEAQETEAGIPTQMSPSAIHQYQMFGLMPIGDTPRQGGWWYHTDAETRIRWYGKPIGGGDTPVGRDRVIDGKVSQYERMIKSAFDKEVRPVDIFGTDKGREQHVPIIDALVNDNEGQFQVNVRNDGALPGLPDDVAVEVPAVVNIKGIQPLRVPPLPTKVMLEQILPNWLSIESTIEALLTGDRSMLLFNVLQSHQTRSYDQAVEVMEALMDLEDKEATDAMRLMQSTREKFQFPKPL
ncbi:MAG: alpha-glucosidase/alpha-galactosidase [Chloroflexi bacterium]|nr:alpha-glucosidase/alpha-galactosidase [Chloroflexota bacterium]